MDLELLLWGVPILVLVSALKAFLQGCGLTGNLLENICGALFAGLVIVVMMLEDLVALLPWLGIYGPIVLAGVVAFLVYRGYWPEALKQRLKAASAMDAALVSLAAALGVAVVLLL
ncbi:MAG TPA: hypothetical protein VM537_09835 [Anaerolineae bacterium]|nr:hypothetical protein [Anaerolineae bacterium]